MWGAFARQIFAYLLTRRGKRALAFVGMLALGFISALLLDMQLYISASFTGTLTLVLMTMWAVQYWRVRQHDRLRERQRLEAAARRLAAAQAREEKYDRAWSSVTDNIRAAGSGTVNTVSEGVTRMREGAAAVGMGLRDGAQAGLATAVATARSRVSSVTLGVAKFSERVRFRRRPADQEPA